MKLGSGLDFLSIRILQVALSKDGKSEIVRDARVNMNKLFCRLRFIPPSNISKIMNQKMEMFFERIAHTKPLLFTETQLELS